MDRRPINDKAGLSSIRQAIRAELNGVGADPSLSFDCLVAVTEACTNALLHGLSGDSRTPVVSWEVNEDSATFWIEDFSAQRWAMSNHPSRSFDSLRTDLKRDLGIALMKDLMDEVVVDTIPRGTMVTLTKRLAPSRPAPRP
jgi:anti-sigma regulatory factor (Ser/Thr protein kinase)